MNEEKQSIRLSEMFTTSLEELTKKMELFDMKVHTDDFGYIRSIELKYMPKEVRTVNRKEETS